MKQIITHTGHLNIHFKNNTYTAFMEDDNDPFLIWIGKKSSHEYFVKVKEVLEDEFLFPTGEWLETEPHNGVSIKYHTPSDQVIVVMDDVDDVFKYSTLMMLDRS